MNPPHKNVDFSDGQREPLWIHVASTVITLLISHHITFGLAWLNPHYHKLINTSVAALKRHFINKLTISYIFSINPPKKKMFHRIRLHLWLCQSPANINREINWFSHLSWYVCVFGDAEWGFCRIANIWISHKDLLNKIVDFSVGSQPCLGSFHTGVSCEFTSHPSMQIRLVTFALIHTEHQRGNFSGNFLEHLKFSPVTFYDCIFWLGSRASGIIHRVFWVLKRMLQEWWCWCTAYKKRSSQEQHISYRPHYDVN